MSKMQTAVATGVHFNIGAMSAQMDVVPGRRPNLGKETELHFFCPDKHDTPARVSIQYVCADGHVHTESELGRAYFGAEGDTPVALSDEDVKQLRCGAIEEKQIDLFVHPIADVEAATVPDESFYRIRPPRKAATQQRKLYALLLRMASDTKLALLGELRFRDGRKLYRLRSFRGQLTLQSLVHPHDLAELDEIDVPELDEKLIELADEVLKASETPFDPAAYGFEAKAVLDEIVARRSDAPLAPVVPINAEAEDLMAKLQASVAQAKKVASPSRTPRKSTARSKKTPAKAAAAAKKSPTRKAV